MIEPPTSDGVTGSVTGVREGHRFDEGALARWLTGHLPGVERGLRVRQFEGGHSNPTYLLETDAGKWVLRKKPSGALLASAHMVEREARILKALRGSGVPVPEVVVACDDASIVGTPFFVMTHVHGRIVREPELPGMTPEERAAVYRVAVETMARLHEVDWGARGLTGYGKPDGYVARQIKRWSEQYRASRPRPVEAMAWLMDWLPSRVPHEAKATIVHGDFRIDNVVLAPDAVRIDAVLDWELSTLGDPWTDVAYFCLPHYLPRGVPGVRGLIGHDASALGIPSVAEIVAIYAAERGVAPPSVETFRVYLAFSMFRFAAIAAGIDARLQQGNASSSHAHDIAGQVATFADAGRRIAEARET